MRPLSLYLVAALLLLLSACGPQPSQEPPTSAESDGNPPEETSSETPQDLFWNHLATLCSNAYEGTMASDDAADADFASQTMVMHVRACHDDRLEIPFHVGEDRSRTWVLTRSTDGILLEHDHRHEDGSPDAVTLYGGLATDTEPGTQYVQYFPANQYSKDLFLANGLDVSVANTWSFEIDPGQRFSYILRRPERHFQADFDLSTTVPEPPPPWGHDPDASS